MGALNNLFRKGKNTAGNVASKGFDIGWNKNPAFAGTRSLMGMGDDGIKNTKKQTQFMANQSMQIGDDLFNRFMSAAAPGLRDSRNATKGLNQLFAGLKKERATDYFDTTEGRGMEKMMSRASDEQRENLAHTSNLMNLTDEAVISGLGRINKTEGNALAGLAAGSDARKNRLTQQMQSTLGQIGAQGLARAGMTSGMYGNAFGNAANILGSAMGNQQANMNANSANMNALLQMIPLFV